MSLEKEFGGGINCSVVDPNTCQLLVGRDQAVYRYAQDTKGICYGKILLQIIRLLFNAFSVYKRVS